MVIEERFIEKKDAIIVVIPLRSAKDCQLNKYVESARSSHAQHMINTWSKYIINIACKTAILKFLAFPSCRQQDTVVNMVIDPSDISLVTASSGFLSRWAVLLGIDRLVRLPLCSCNSGSGSSGCPRLLGRR